jgi:hypothetical protein
VPTNRAEINLIKARLFNALLALLVCIHSYLKSVLKYKCLILNIYHPDTVYLRQQRCEYPWLFSEAKKDPRAK